MSCLSFSPPAAEYVLTVYYNGNFDFEWNIYWIEIKFSRNPVVVILTSSLFSRLIYLPIAFLLVVISVMLRPTSASKPGASTKDSFRINGMSLRKKPTFLLFFRRSCFCRKIAKLGCEITSASVMSFQTGHNNSWFILELCAKSGK